MEKREEYEDKYLNLVRNILPRVASIRKYSAKQEELTARHFERITLDMVLVSNGGGFSEDVPKPIHSSVTMPVLKYMVDTLDQMYKSRMFYEYVSSSSKKRRQRAAQAEHDIVMEADERKMISEAKAFERQKRLDSLVRQLEFRTNIEQNNLIF